MTQPKPKPAAAAASPSRSGAKVTVGCKLPNGLILRLFRMDERQEQVMGGGTRTAKVASQVGEPVRLNGSAVPFGKTPNFVVEGGYALTQNVDAEFFAEWMRQNADHELVKTKMIFAVPTLEAARAQATEQAELRSGLEPMEQDKDPRVPRPATPNLSALGPGEKDAA